MVVMRPFLAVRRVHLRSYLNRTSQPWREDASNVSTAYQRNRIRQLLLRNPDLFGALIDLGGCCRAVRDWVRDHAPRLDERFAVAQLADLPRALAAESARRWLLDRGVDPDQVSPDAITRLIDMACDAASPARQDFPGALHIRRRRGMIFVDRPGAAHGAGPDAG
jgi:hypothetical protein